MPCSRLALALILCSAARAAVADEPPNGGRESGPGFYIYSDRLPQPPKPIDAPAPAIMVSSDVVDFGPELLMRTSASRQLVVSNTGDAPLVLSGVKIGGPDGGDFLPVSVPATFPYTIQPQQALTLTYAFKPTSDGAKNGTLAILSNDSGRPEVDVRFAGTGIASPVTVAPATIDFGVYSQNAKAQPVAVKITNISAWPIQVTMTIPGGANPDAFTIDPVVGTLMPGDSFSAHAAFSTAKLGVEKGTVTFALDDPNLKPPILQLSGEVVQGFFKVDPASLDFGDTLVGTASAKQVTVTNLTSAPQHLAGLVADDPRFTVDPGPLATASLDPGKSAAFTVLFRPTTVGPASGHVQLVPEGTTMPDATVSLAGAGTPPQIEGRGWACALDGRRGSSSGGGGGAGAIAALGIALALCVRRRRRAI